jgi:RNA polymerase sigma factor (sigma-70 family)
MGPEDKSLLEIYLGHRSRLHALASGIVGCRAKGEDIVQEVWIRVETEIPDEKNVKRPFQYLWSIVYRLSVDARREAAREPAIIGTSSPLENGKDADSVAPPHAVETALVDPVTSERDVAAREELERVMNVLATLPPRTRKAFEMSQIYGFTQREVAHMLGVSAPRVSTMIKEAARRLNDAFGDED